MNGPTEQTRTNSSSQSWRAGSGAAFQFDRGDDWVRMSADFGRLREVVGEQMRKAVADINVDAIAEEVRRTLTDVVDEVRQAVIPSLRRSLGMDPLGFGSTSMPKAHPNSLPANLPKACPRSG